MRHRKGNRKLSKPTDQRIALLRNMSTALFANKKILTTEKRAKEVRKMVEKLITLGRKADVSALRRIRSILYNRKSIRDVINTCQEGRFEGKVGGYTRIIKVGSRRGDGASMVYLELV